MTVKVLGSGEAYPKGTVLLTEKPFAYVLKSKLRFERCDYCFKKFAEVKKCSGCDYVYYCDVDCQKKGWYFHKRECANIKKVSPNTIPDAARLLARIVIKLEKGGAHERSFYSKTHFRVWRDLKSHYNEVKKDLKRLEHFAYVQEILQLYLGKDGLPNSAELLAMYGKMVINNFGILDNELNCIGTGVYLAASVLDHACSPNAVPIFDGITLQIRTIKDLANIDMSQIFISYIDVLDSTKKRQDALEEAYYFTCQCQKCLDVKEMEDMTSVICQNEKCGNAVPLTRMDVLPVCEKCNEQLSIETIEKISDVIDFTEQQLAVMKDVAYLDVCQMCLRKQEGLLHPMNIYNVKILGMAVESCIALQNMEGAFSYGRQARKILRRYFGEYHPAFGMFLLIQGKIALYLEQLEEARELITEAARILKVTHGETHSLIKEDLQKLLLESEMALNVFKKQLRDS